MKLSQLKDAYYRGRSDARLISRPINDGIHTFAVWQNIRGRYMTAAYPWPPRSETNEQRLYALGFDHVAAGRAALSEDR